MIVVSDTTAVNYLILTEHVGVLHDLYDVVIIPEALQRELTCAAAPEKVRLWMAQKPVWLEVHPAEHVTISSLDQGEAETLALAQAIGADLVLMDERRGRAAAAEMHLAVTGVVGIMAQAADAELIVLRDALEALQRTSYRISDTLIAAALERDRTRRANT